MQIITGEHSEAACHEISSLSFRFSITRLNLLDFTIETPHSLRSRIYSPRLHPLNGLRGADTAIFSQLSDRSIFD